MKIFNVLIRDRHCDSIIHNFTGKDAAIKLAWKTAREYNNHPEDLEVMLYAPNDNDGWLLLIIYSCEGDYVRVSEGELNYEKETN